MDLSGGWALIAIFEEVGDRQPRERLADGSLKARAKFRRKMVQE